MLNYLSLNYYHIKVVIDEYDYVYIDIYPHYSIKDVKDIINKKQGKITPKFFKYLKEIYYLMKIELSKVII